MILALGELANNIKKTTTDDGITFTNCVYFQDPLKLKFEFCGFKLMCVSFETTAY